MDQYDKILPLCLPTPLKNTETSHIHTKYFPFFFKIIKCNLYVNVSFLVGFSEIYHKIFVFKDFRDLKIKLLFQKEMRGTSMDVVRFFFVERDTITLSFNEFTLMD